MSSKAVIFDRDGTLIEDADYLSDPEGIVLFSDTSDIIRRLRKDGYIIIVITNQSGIARGLYNIEDA
jgi:HAD superfamily hydrolase (TIGR01662 family)